MIGSILLNILLWILATHAAHIHSPSCQATDKVRPPNANAVPKTSLGRASNSLAEHLGNCMDKKLDH